MNIKENKFIKTVWEYYRREGRHGLPWRHTTNPYRILVSEVMLQQTQVERVIPKYGEFLKKFPTVQALSGASLGDVLRVWQGLGYNRRAKMLHECARIVVGVHKGRFPKTLSELVSLPGVGPYTAGAVLAFAYNVPTVLIETNIRTVYLYHFFKNMNGIADSEITRLIEKTLDSDTPREWYYALMDYGAYIKRTFGNQNMRSKHHILQTKFKGSGREVRGVIVQLLSVKSKTLKELISATRFPSEKIEAQLSTLQRDGLVTVHGNRYTLPE